MKGAAFTFTDWEFLKGAFKMKVQWTLFKENLKGPLKLFLFIRYQEFHLLRDKAEGYTQCFFYRGNYFIT